jgi:geranylgeranyl diphosphate synthase type I
MHGLSTASRKQQGFTHSMEPSDNGLLANDRGLSEAEQLMYKLVNRMVSKRAKQMLLQHLSTGGKRIRARLALAAIEALGGERSQAVAWAAAVELLHNASLIHDDIQDGDRMRRGEPTIWARHGMTQAINAGDILLMLPFLAINEVNADPLARSQLSALLARRAADTVSGQIEELEMLSEQRFSFAEYVATVRRKTGELLALSVEGAAIIAGKDPEEAQAIAESFIDLGTLFQLQDDILDLYGDKGRGHVGSDLYEGKVSGLVVAHLSIHPEDRRWLIDLLRKERDKTPVLEVKQAIESFRNGGALDHVLSFINQIIERLHRAASLRDEAELYRLAIELSVRAMKPIRHVIDSHKNDHEQNRTVLGLANQIVVAETPC